MRSDDDYIRQPPGGALTGPRGQPRYQPRQRRAIVENELRPAVQAQVAHILPAAHLVDRIAGARATHMKRFVLDPGIICPFPINGVFNADVGRNIFRAGTQPADDRTARGPASLARNRSALRLLPGISAVKQIACVQIGELRPAQDGVLVGNIYFSVAAPRFVRNVIRLARLPGKCYVRSPLSINRHQSRASRNHRSRSHGRQSRG